MARNFFFLQNVPKSLLLTKYWGSFLGIQAGSSSLLTSASTDKVEIESVELQICTLYTSSWYGKGQLYLSKFCKCVVEQLKQLIKPIPVAMQSKAVATLEPEPTQHNTVWRDSKQGSRNQPRYCLCHRLHWNWSDWYVVFQQLLTAWPNKVGLFLADSLARHLLQFA